MEMKRLGTILSGLCLLLALSVSSVVVAAPCDTCAKCDQDGDTLIRISSFCQRKCPDQATDLDDEPPGMCLVDDGVTKYTVTLTGDLKGTSDPDGWSAARSGKKFLGLDGHPPPMTLDLSFFVTGGDEGAEIITGATNCFPNPGMTSLFAATIAQRNIKGGKQAEAS